jgi:FlaA1/EpsC-like NDP-sugar epimerase
MSFDAARRLSVRVSRYAAILSIDAFATAFGLYAAVLLRFELEGTVPPTYQRALAFGIPLLVAIRVGCNVAARLHRCCFYLVGLTEAMWVAAAGFAGTVLYVAATWPTPYRMPRSVYVLEFFFATTAFGAIRFAPRILQRLRTQLLARSARGARTIIVGASGDAELLARDLVRDPDHRYDIVGFVCEDPRLVGLHMEGRPVLGLVDELPDVIGREAVSTVLLADPRQPATRTRRILDMCAASHARFKIVPASFRYLESRVSAAMLDDVKPEDLLPRERIVFDDAELEALVRGRRALVTGAGGSIGGEISRQLARHGVSQLVMVDLNENELYLGARRLAEEWPGVDVRAEVADIRELSRLLRLGARYRPQDVFHAAAHKHVPLMEDAPEEAVKNNVFGTMHVARMAMASGAERFVLISTDKAVKPSSVMGATKRVAELVVRALAHSTRCQMTCVRFGNVLGSAGSVVPLFRQQIARGGPVTVTHPECTRYFMTIPEAVGLVLLAGLGGYGDLCVLDMGEAIRISELARNMITLAGRVPGEEIPIVFTGLRPGEKLYEEVLTDEEERSQRVRNRIRATFSPAPPPDLVERLDRLRRCSDDGDQATVLAQLRELVPTYQPRAWELAAAAPEAELASGPAARDVDNVEVPGGDAIPALRPADA